MPQRTPRGLVLLSALKVTGGGQGPVLRLPVGSPVCATLRPVSASAADVKLLTDSRNLHATAFLTEFLATEKRTAAWLKEQVGPDDTRIIFMADESSGQTFGCIGLASIDWLAGSFELDGVMRSTPACRGGMSEALRALVGWSISELGLKEPRVRVRSDNPHAVRFYSRLGFVEKHRSGLSRVRTGSDEWRWVESRDAAPDGPYLVYMAADPSGFTDVIS